MNGVTKYLHAGLKSADAQSSGSQSITGTRVYDAFGNVESSSGSWTGAFGYGGPYGYQSAGEGGLMLLGHRYYDPSTGRFLTGDPIQHDRNWYAYGAGDIAPTFFIGPTGLGPFEFIGKICGMLAGGAVATAVVVGGSPVLVAIVGGGMVAGVASIGAGAVGQLVDGWIRGSRSDELAKDVSASIRRELLFPVSFLPGPKSPVKQLPPIVQFVFEVWLSDAMEKW